MEKLLIQANNLDSVIDTFMFIHSHPGCTKKDLAQYLDFSLRQVDYYTNACKYLDLIDEHWGPTLLSEDIYKNNLAEITERVYERIISDNVIGKIFAKIYSFPEIDNTDYAQKVVKQYFPGYSESVYNRRTDNLIKWCKKIIIFLNKKQNL